MSWFLIAIIGYLLYALVTVINKFLLGQRATTRPIVFTFYLGILSIFTFVLIPFGLGWPGGGAFLFDILVGFIYFAAIWTFYEALDINEASRVSPLISGLSTLCVPVFAYFVLSERLTLMQVLAFLLLVIGGFLISIKRTAAGVKKNIKGLKFVILTILLGAIYWILAKYAFDSQSFITGFVWTRLGFVLASLAVLLRPAWRRVIFISSGQLTQGLGAILVSGKILAGFGSLAIHYALALGSASLTNALAGVEFAILLILTTILSKKYPQFVEEKLSFKIFIQKSIAILLISAGLAILAL